MAYKYLRTNPDGKRVYRLTYKDHHKINTDTGKPTDYQITWTTPEKWIPKRADKEAAKADGEFASKCKAGEFIRKKERKLIEKEEIRKAVILKNEYEESPSLTGFLDRYCKERKLELKPGSFTNSIIPIWNRFVKYIGDVKIRDVSESVMRDYINSLFLESGMKYSTCCTHFDVLMRIFLTAVDDKVIPESPMRNIKKPQKSMILETDETVKILTPEQINYFYQCVDQEPSKWRALLIFAGDTGARRGEIAGMKWENIDLETGKVRICINVQFTKEKRLYETTPKNGKVREFYLTGYALSVMREWKRLQETESIYFRGAYKPVYCFDGVTGGPMNPNTISNYIKRFADKYGFEGFHIHMLRHTNATISIANGEDVLTVSKKLGHSDPGFTLRIYCHSSLEQQRKLSDNFEKIVYGSRIESDADYEN